MIPQALAQLAETLAVFWVLHGLGLRIARIIWRANMDTLFWVLVRLVFTELRPLYLPAVIIIIARDAQQHRLLGWDSLLDACWLVDWWLFKDEGDDRWKRRRAKLVAAIRRRGARLVVVPAPPAEAGS
jgi:hypothetical protein